MWRYFERGVSTGKRPVYGPLDHNISQHRVLLLFFEEFQKHIWCWSFVFYSAPEKKDLQSRWEIEWRSTVPILLLVASESSLLLLPINKVVLRATEENARLSSLDTTRPDPKNRNSQ